MARYALVIGISEYTGCFNSLETPAQNANAIADILDQYGDFNQVKRLPFRRELGQKNLGKVIRKPLPNATLVQELQQFLQDADGSDVLIYYSGHGFTKLDQLSHSPEGYLAPSDCQVEANSAGQIIAERNGISLFGLNALINRHTFNSLVVILDCCNAGAFLEGGMVRRDVTAFDYQRDYYLITACRSASQSYEGEDYSLLTTAILKGLSPENAAPGSGQISGDRLFDVIGNELKNSRQEPLRMGWGRLITLVRYLQRPDSAESVAHSFNAANPYMGLKPFEREQAAYFFGRQLAVRALLERLNANHFLAVIGPSGCGKSSLVKAGLLPELESDRIPGSRDWCVEIITPGQYPLQTLTQTLERHHADSQPLVLFVDQFEELFTLCPYEEEQRSFIKRLNQETSAPDRQTRIIIAMRGDFLDRCAKFQESADLINSTAPTTYIVTPLTEAKLVAELEESITCPAALHGVSFEPGLVARIVDDVINQPGAMPLLQYALTQLWDQCIWPNGSAQVLTIHSYEAIEGVKGALQRWADQFYTNLSHSDQAFVRDMVSELVQIGDEGEVTRRRASWHRLREIASSQDQLDRIIGRLVYQRLLVADDKTVEVAHEALLSESRLIQGWIEENRDSIRLQQRLETYRREWEEHDRTEDYLLDAGRLAAIEEWMERKHPHLTSADHEFIGNSRERRDRLFAAQLEQERRLREEAEGRAIAEIEKKIEAEQREREALARIKAERRGKRFAIAAGILAVFTLSLGVLAQIRQGEIKQKQLLSIGTMIDKTEQLLETHNELEALIASIEALKTIQETKQDSPELLEKLQKIIFQIHEYDRLYASTSGLYSLDFSPDGEVIVAAGSDKQIKLWNLERNTVSNLIPVHKGEIFSVKFSPNGKLLASAGGDDSVNLWDNHGNLLHTFLHDSNVYAVSFSKDSQLLAASSKNGTIRIWNTKRFDLVRQLSNAKHRNVKEGSYIYGVNFDPSRRDILINTGYKNYDVALWNIAKDSEPIKILGQSKDIILETKFSHDGSMILSCDNQGVLKLWSFNGQQIGQINNLNDPLYYADFSSDDKYIVSSGLNSVIKIWSVKDVLKIWDDSRKGLIVASDSFKVNGGYINQVVFMPLTTQTLSNSLKIASVSQDGTVRIWEVLKSQELPPHTTTMLLTKSCKRLRAYSRLNVEASLKLKRLCN